MLDALALFTTWADWNSAREWLSRKSRLDKDSPESPFLAINHPVQQHMLLTGRVLFKGMVFDDLRRMQVDIETHTAPGFEFCNPDREADRIAIIAMGDSSGWEEALCESSGDEKRLIERFVEVVRERDPDVIEGHNIFKFDLAYISARAARHGVKLALGRDGSLLRSRAGRFTAGERAISYPRFEIAGRHIVDTYFLLQAYDASHRSLESYGLKQAAAHFHVSAPNRALIEGSNISDMLESDPSLVRRYALDDIRETRALAGILARSQFAQSAMLPFDYQTACLRGSAAKIDALMLKEYLRAGRSLPLPEKRRGFQGGYTDIFMRGVIPNVHHCDARSLYPSIMLSKRIGPKSDHLGAFLQLLERLRGLRMDAVRKMDAAPDKRSKAHYESMQAAFKILTNSFYGYLGFAQGRFNDFDAAERIAAEGRAILKNMVDWLRAHGASPVEVDTDGVYFVPPAFSSAKQRDEFREALRRSLPEGIEIEFDGEYKAMFSYKMKNYALLHESGDITIRGAALKSRGLEPYLREFMREFIRLKLESKDKELPVLKARYEKALADGQFSIKKLAKTETLQDAPEVYAARIAKGARARNAAYELALRSDRPYQAGDQLSYYIAGTGKRVSAHSAAKRAWDWNPAARDENIAYYTAKLNALYNRLITGADADSDD